MWPRQLRPMEDDLVAQIDAVRPCGEGARAGNPMVADQGTRDYGDSALVIVVPANGARPSIAWTASFRDPGCVKDGAKRRRAAAGEAGP